MYTIDGGIQAHVPFQAAMSQGGRDYVPELQFNSNINEPLSEMPRAKPKKGGKEKKLSQRGKAFSKEEDRIICSAFLNVSKDPITCMFCSCRIICSDLDVVIL